MRINGLNIMGSPQDIKRVAVKINRATKLSSNKLVRDCQIQNHMVEVKKAHKETR